MNSKYCIVIASILVLFALSASSAPSPLKADANLKKSNLKGSALKSDIGYGYGYCDPYYDLYCGDLYYGGYDYGYGYDYIYCDPYYDPYCYDYGYGYGYYKRR